MTALRDHFECAAGNTLMHLLRNFDRRQHILLTDDDDRWALDRNAGKSEEDEVGGALEPGGVDSVASELVKCTSLSSKRKL